MGNLILKAWNINCEYESAVKNGNIDGALSAANKFLRVLKEIEYLSPSNGNPPDVARSRDVDTVSEHDGKLIREQVRLEQLAKRKRLIEEFIERSA